MTRWLGIFWLDFFGWNNFNVSHTERKRNGKNQLLRFKRLWNHDRKNRLTKVVVFTVGSVSQPYFASRNPLSTISIFGGTLRC